MNSQELWYKLPRNSGPLPPFFCRFVEEFYRLKKILHKNFCHNKNKLRSWRIYPLPKTRKENALTTPYPFVYLCRASDVQLEFTMLDPHIRTFLQHDGQVNHPYLPEFTSKIDWQDATCMLCALVSLSRSWMKCRSVALAMEISPPLGFATIHNVTENLIVSGCASLYVPVKLERMVRVCFNVFDLAARWKPSVKVVRLFASFFASQNYLSWENFFKDSNHPNWLNTWLPRQLVSACSDTVVQVVHEYVLEILFLTTIFCRASISQASRFQMYMESSSSSLITSGRAWHAWRYKNK